MLVSLIFALDENNAIGLKNQLPWHLPADLKLFKKYTTGHTIIMGRKTFESIGKPLPNRTNIVITRQQNYNYEGVTIKHSLQDAIDFARKNGETETFFIGGAELFKNALPLAHRYYLTRIHHTFEADTWLPKINHTNWDVIEEQSFIPDDKNKYPFTFMILERKKMQ